MQLQVKIELSHWLKLLRISISVHTKIIIIINVFTKEEYSYYVQSYSIEPEGCGSLP